MKDPLAAKVANQKRARLSGCHSKVGPNFSASMLSLPLESLGSLDLPRVSLRNALCPETMIALPHGRLIMYEEYAAIAATVNKAAA